jgi:uncharacterized protein (TIGR02996 family)
MLSDDAFLQAILHDPDSDAPRLVYADWLEETGGTERAELIRLQCGGVNPARERELIQRFAKQWAGPIAELVYSFTFRRGFTEEVTIEAGIFLESGAILWAAAPIRLLRIIGARLVLDRLFRSPWLGRLRALHLTDCRVGDEGARRLAACAHLHSLQTLRLGNNALGDEAAEALASSGNFEALHALVLSGNQIEDGGAYLLAAGDAFPNLVSLDLSDNQIGAAGAEALSCSSSFRRLQALNLADQHKATVSTPGSRGRPLAIQPKQRAALAQRFGAESCVF